MRCDDCKRGLHAHGIPCGDGIYETNGQMYPRDWGYEILISTCQCDEGTTMNHPDTHGDNRRTRRTLRAWLRDIRARWNAWCLDVDATIHRGDL